MVFAKKTHSPIRSFYCSKISLKSHFCALLLKPRLYLNRASILNFTVYLSDKDIQAAVKLNRNHRLQSIVNCLLLLYANSFTLVFSRVSILKFMYMNIEHSAVLD